MTTESPAGVLARYEAITQEGYVGWYCRPHNLVHLEARMGPDGPTWKGVTVADMVESAGEHERAVHNGLAVWPSAVARVFTPTVIPADVTAVATEAGVVWRRMASGHDLWERPDLPAVGRGWVTTTQLLLGGPVTEVVGDAE
jgi:hypothetical protein